MRRIETVVPFIMLVVAALLALLIGPRMLGRYTTAQQSARIELARNELLDDDILRRIDRAVAAIADSVNPGVVHIETSGRGRGSASSGAGWVFDTRGHIITNAHVVGRSRRISVEFSDGSVRQGRLVGTDIYTDIAVLQVDRGNGLFPIMRSAARLPRVGERVYAFGSPFGFKFSMSEGIVSGLGRSTPGSSIPGGYTNYIQTDAAVNPGNSGGPLVNTDGHVVGMNVAIATAQSIGAAPDESGGDSAGISFAIPLGTIEPIVDQLIEYGEVSRGYLGIRFGGAPRTDGIERVVFEDGSTMTGVRVSGVVPDGPSDQAGLRADDVIVSVEGSPILTSESLVSLISSGRPGDSVDVKVWREGLMRSMTVVLAPILPEVLAQRIATPTMIQLGARLIVGDAGMLVADLFTDFPAQRSGLRSGDQITAINGKSFPGWNEFFVLLADEGLLAGEAVDLTVLGQDGGTRMVRLAM
ncbi:MAG: trypsin-like peptidase domain-containing protein [Planctomycetota bacterium]